MVVLQADVRDPAEPAEVVAGRVVLAGPGRGDGRLRPRRRAAEQDGDQHEKSPHGQSHARRAARVMAPPDC